MIRLAEGEVRVSVLDGGSLWLDGGAMFGVVPKPLWEKKRHADEGNRVRLAMNVLLVEDGKKRWLVDTGAGTKEGEKFRAIHRLDAKSPDEILAPAGLTPEDIDVVVCSHLHFDHAGGNTKRDDSGALVPAFPNARYVMQRGELEFARIDNERIRAAYLADNYEPLVAASRVELVDGDVPLDPRIRLVQAPGHTPHHQIVLVAAEGRTVAFLADLVPMSSHVPYGWIMGFDLEPLRTLESKKRILPRALGEEWRIVFEHDGDLPVGILQERDGKVSARPFEGGA